MKKKLIFLLSLLILAAPVFGDYTLSEYRRQVTQLGSAGRYDPIVQIIQSLGAGGVSTGTGETFYVDSGVSGGADDGSSWENAFDTLDEAFASGYATANRGDVIYVAQGHAESGTAAGLFDADVAGVTVIGLGNGTNAPTFTFADTDTTCVLGAANVVLYNLRFLAGISEVVTGISVEAAADDCAILRCVFPEPTTSTFEFDEAITVASGADRLLVRECIAYSADATGASSWIDLTAGVNNGTRIIGNTIHGEFSNAPIYSTAADLETYVLSNNVTQLTASQFCIEFTAAATGICANNLCNPATVDFEVDPGSMMFWNNNEGTTFPEQVSLYDVTGGYSGDGGANSDDSIKAATDLIVADTNELQTDLTNGGRIDLLIDALVENVTSYNATNYINLSVDLTSATWNTAAAHEVATVTGAVRMWIIVECTETLTDAADGATLILGTENDTNAFIASTSAGGSGGANQLDAGELWIDATPADLSTALVTAAAGGAIIDAIIVNGDDVGYTIGSEALTDGTLVFHMWWAPISSTGAVVVGAGGAL